MGPGALSEMLAALPVGYEPNLLVGFDTSDDACVYRLRDDLVMIQTVDFFPPIVDDPYHYGQIAAANALSDIYAMGVEPSLALNILGIPACLPAADVAAIIAGGAEKVREAGAVIAGGHSVEDTEPKYGLCVSAFCRPEEIWSNAGAQAGDVLALTKPLGNGILATAAKRDLIGQAEFLPAIEAMARLNKHARDAAVGLNVRACTDVTGFGFLGHAYEMAEASGCSFEIFADSLPLLEGAYELAERGVVPGGAERNEAYLAGKLCFADNVAVSLRAILFDPQTSGGLLFSLPEDDARKLDATVVGRVHKRGDFHIKVVP